LKLQVFWYIMDKMALNKSNKKIRGRKLC
jgi:hypothetical protein